MTASGVLRRLVDEHVVSNINDDSSAPPLQKSAKTAFLRTQAQFGRTAPTAGLFAAAGHARSHPAEDSNLSVSRESRCDRRGLGCQPRSRSETFGAGRWSIAGQLLCAELGQGHTGCGAQQRASSCASSSRPSREISSPGALMTSACVHRQALGRSVISSCGEVRDTENQPDLTVGTCSRESCAVHWRFSHHGAPPHSTDARIQQTFIGPVWFPHCAVFSASLLAAAPLLSVRRAGNRRVLRPG